MDEISHRLRTTGLESQWRYRRNRKTAMHLLKSVARTCDVIFGENPFFMLP